MMMMRLAPEAGVPVRVLSILCLVLALAGCRGPHVRIAGQAMSPTLEDGERWQVDPATGEIRRGDVVAFYYPQDQSRSFVKRVIGLPGEQIVIRDGDVFVNGTPLEESYVLPENRSKDDLEVVVPSDQFLMLGDNRRNSSDSRHWGAVARDLIWGKVVLH